MKGRLSLALSVTAVVVAVLGATPFGRAAGERLAAAVPYAKTAGYAKFAGDSTKLNGRKSTLAGAPGTIPVVGKTGKLPASIGTVGLQGPQGLKGDKGAKGDKGDEGDKGDKGDTGAAGATSVVVRTAQSGPGLNPTGFAASQCAPGERATGGGVLAVNIPFTEHKVVNSYPVPQTGTPTGWGGTVVANAADADAVVVAYAICAAP